MGFAVEANQIATEDDAFEIWKENWPSLRVWLAVETQWRIVIAGSSMIWLGLDYSAVDVVLRRHKAEDTVFEDLQDMEQAALAVFVKASNEQ
jgi:hypothetical protein